MSPHQKSSHISINYRSSHNQRALYIEHDIMSIQITTPTHYYYECSCKLMRHNLSLESGETNERDILLILTPC